LKIEFSNKNISTAENISTGKLKYFFHSSKIEEFWDCVLSQQGRIELYNVNACDISYLITTNENKRSAQELRILLNSIKSINGITDALFLLDLPSVDELEYSNRFGRASGTPDLSSENYQISKPPLEHLKKMEIHIRRAETAEKIVPILQKMLFHERCLVTDLKLIVDDRLLVGDDEDRGNFMYPRSLGSFKSLKKLYLDCRTFGQAEYIELFSVLAANTKLERLELLISDVVDDDDFFYGPDRNNPIFLQMSREY